MLKNLEPKEIEILPRANYNFAYLCKVFVEYPLGKKQELFRMNEIQKEQIKNYKRSR